MTSGTGADSLHPKNVGCCDRFCERKTLVSFGTCGKEYADGKNVVRFAVACVCHTITTCHQINCAVRCGF